MARTTTKKHRSHNISNDVENIKRSLLNATRNVTGHAGDFVSRSYEDAKDRSAEIHEDVSGYLSERPIKAVSIAAGLGLLVGYLLHK